MNIELRLREVMVIEDPGVQVTEGVMSRVAERLVPVQRHAGVEHIADARARRRSRFILVGTVLVVAAAAAVLWLQWSGGAAPEAEVSVAVVAEPVTAVAPEPAPATAPAPATSPTTAKVVLQLDALQFQGENEEARAAVREFYDTMEKGLRAIPGLLVVLPGQTSTADLHIDFRLTVFGESTPGRWGARAQLQRPENPKALQLMITGSNLPSACANAASRPFGMCVSASQLASEQVNHFRLELVPGDLEFRGNLRATALDGDESFVERFNALGLLARKAPGDMDAQVIRAALDLIAQAPHPYGIERLLEMLRGHSDPALKTALIDMAGNHPAASVRAEALSMLIDGFKSDPAARSAIESLAVADQKSLITQVAERAFSGDAQWNAYLRATVKDASLTPSQRFAPLAYLMQTEQKEDVRKVLDEDLIGALKDVLPGVVGGNDESVALAAFGVMALIPDSGTPAGVDLMIATWDGVGSASYRAIAIDPLLLHRKDPRVRRKLEEIAASDPDPQLRERAAAAL